MKNEEKASAPAQSLMDALLERQQAGAAAGITRGRRRFPPIKWLSIGALVGLAAGTTLEYLLTRTVAYWGVVGIGTGMAIGSAFDADRTRWR